MTSAVTEIYYLNVALAMYNTGKLALCTMFEGHLTALSCSYGYVPSSACVRYQTFSPFCTVTPTYYVMCKFPEARIATEY